jgi:hypothetical protein
MSVRQDVRVWRQSGHEKRPDAPRIRGATGSCVYLFQGEKGLIYGIVRLTGLLSALSLPLLVYAFSEKYHVPEVRPSIT